MGRVETLGERQKEMEVKSASDSIWDASENNEGGVCAGVGVRVYYLMMRRCVVARAPIPRSHEKTITTTTQHDTVLHYIPAY